jgi:hypothetical protein
VAVDCHGRVETPSSKTRAIKILEETELEGVYCKGLG